MTYDAQEISAAGGQPYFLYKFANSNGTTTYLTSHPESLVRDSQTWTPSSVFHSDIEVNGKVETNNVDISFALSDSFGSTFLEVISGTVVITIYRGHLTDGTDELQVIWKGRYVGSELRGNRVILRVESIFTSMRAPGCRARMTKMCRHPLYSDGCGVAIGSFSTSGTLTAISTSGNQYTVTGANGEADGYYKSGLIIWNGAYGYIHKHEGNVLSVLTPIPGLKAYFDVYGSQSVTIAAGCNLKFATCRDKFSNELNFGGFPYMTVLNPFSSSIA